MSEKLQMIKEKIIKEDGRYLIYYRFDEEVVTEEGDKCVRTPL